MERVVRSVGLVMVVLATVAVAEENGAPQAAPVAMPDVRGNVMRMLEESRSREGAEAVVEAALPVAEEHPLQHAAPAAAAENPVPPPVVPHTTEPPPPPARTKAVVSAPPAAAAAPPRRDNHVPLEQKEITIESLDDIRKLSAELKAAKQRHTAQGAAE